MKSLSFCWIVALGAFGCSGPADIPDTPDLRSLLSNYDRPTADLDQTSAVEALHGFPQLEQLDAAFLASQLPVDSLKDLASPAATDTGSGVRVQGSISATLRCPGDLDTPVLDPAVNGSVTITLAVANNRIRRSFGGRANACVLRGNALGQSVRVKIDGPIAFDLGGDIGLGARWSGTLLMRIEGDLEVANAFTLHDASARYSDGRWEHLFALKDGSTIVAAVAPTGVSIRDARGLWLCLDSRACAR